MPIIETGFGNALPIDGIGPGFFRVGGQVLRGNLLIHAGGAQGWGGFEDVEPLAAFAGQVDVIFIGMGPEIAHPPRAFRQALEAHGLMIEPMASAAAARAYNVLLAEGRAVVAALLALPEAV